MSKHAMNSRTFLLTATALVFLTASGCSTAPKSREGKADIVEESERALAKARQTDSTIDDVLDDAYGIAVFPKVGKGAVVRDRASCALGQP